MAPRAHLRLTRTRVTATVLALALLALHLDFWRLQRPRIWFGWIPEELLWRLGWMGLAFAYLVYFCSFVWGDDTDPRA